MKLSHLRITIGHYFSFYKISKHKANTTELHPKVRPTFVCLECATGWTYLHHTKHCYKFFTHPRSWSDAKDHCSKQMNGRGVLATVHDKYTNNFLVWLTAAFAGSSPEATSWIGGQYNVAKDPPWHWQDDSEFNYNHILGYIEDSEGIAINFNV